MPTEHQCPKCGAVLSVDAPKGLCPRCLMAAALGTELPVAVKLTIRNEPGDEEEVSQRIDRYKILQKLGEGGCGIVYMAEQTEPVRRWVALKVIKLGMDTRQVIARFEAERQALALMDHPNIAKVLDAGTTEKGRPYFVMELVKGVRITDYCDQHHLTTPQRLGLFTQVCHAIQHAHQKGIIHRDIKPSNILVTLHDGVPVPKVIDFGIAKATEQILTEKTVFTAFGQFMGTPAYMSPEQAELSGLDIDTRSDIYALGVLLYELLTGKTPFDAKELLQAGLDEMRRRIREEEPMRPSTRLSTLANADLTTIAQQRQSEPTKLTRFIRGDLDWIVMKCLEKDRTRRYETANGLATDIRRHLENEPVVACPPSAAYRFQKLIRRNKLTVVSVSAVTAMLFLGLGISTKLWLAEREAHGKAVKAEQEGQEKLRAAYLSQARANRWSGRAGRRFDTLDVLAKAVAIRPGLDLRNEAIAALALMDVKPFKEWEGNSNHFYDSRYQRYARPEPDGTIIIRQVKDDAEVGRIPGFGIPVQYIEFSRDGNLMWASYRKEKEPVSAFQVYDLREAGKSRFELNGPWVRTARFSPDSRRLAVSRRKEEGKNDMILTIFELSSGVQLNSFPTPQLPYGLAFNPDGSRLAVSSELSSSVNIYSVPEGNRLETLPHGISSLNALAWSDDGRTLAVSGDDGQISLWNVAGQAALLRKLPHGGAPRACFFTHRGDVLMSWGWNQTAKFWDVRTGQELLRLPANTVTGISADDRFIGLDPLPANGGVAHFSDAKECRIYRLDSNANGVHGVGLSPDSRWMATGHPDGLRLWDLTTGQVWHEPSQGELGVSRFSSDGSKLIGHWGDRVLVWPFEVRERDGASEVKFGRVTSLKGETPGSIIATNRAVGIVSGQARVFDSTTLRIEKNLTSPDWLYSAVISSDGRHAAAWPINKEKIVVWDVNDGRQLTTLACSPSPCLGFSPDGRWLAAGSATEYVFWERESWAKHKAIPRGRSGGTHGRLAFAPDGKTVALSLGAGDVSLFDTTTFEVLATLETPETSGVSGLSFGADGSLLAISTTTGVICVWDLRLVRQQLAALKLDWKHPALPPNSNAPPIQPLTMTFVPKQKYLNAVQSEIPRRDPRCTEKQIDLGRHFNATFYTFTEFTGMADNDLSSVPHGLTTLRGIDFDLRGVVQVGLPAVGSVAKGIAIGQRCRSLHFLHSALFLRPRGIRGGTNVAAYVIHWEDGKTGRISVQNYVHLADWWGSHSFFAARPHLLDTNTTFVAWHGVNPASARSGEEIQLYQFRWDNPRPEVAISSLDFEAVDAAPFLLAITAE